MNRIWQPVFNPVFRKTNGKAIVTDPIPDFTLRYKMDALDLLSGVNSPSLIDGIAKLDCQALEFNGVDEYLNKDVDASKLVGKQGVFSISFWIYPVSIPTTLLYSIAGFGTSANGGTGFQIVMPINAAPLIRYISGAAGFNSTTQLTLNKWNHVVFTINGNSRKCYVNNGTPNTNTNTTNTFTATTLKFATNSTGTATFAPVRLDDFRFYPRELSAAEVTVLWNYYCNELTFNGEPLTFNGEPLTFDRRA